MQELPTANANASDVPDREASILDGLQPFSPPEGVSAASAVAAATATAPSIHSSVPPPNLSSREVNSPQIDPTTASQPFTRFDLERHPAAAVLRHLAPTCAPSVIGRLRRERIKTTEDLAGLDKDDLRELGLSMVERSRVLRWARDQYGASGPVGEQIQQGSNANSNLGSRYDLDRNGSARGSVCSARGSTFSARGSFCSAHGDNMMFTESLNNNREDGLATTVDEELGRDIVPPMAVEVDMNDQIDGRTPSYPGTPHASVDFGLVASMRNHSSVPPVVMEVETMEEDEYFMRSISDIHDTAASRHLDDVEQRTDFWCSLIAVAQPQSTPPIKSLRSQSLDSLADAELSDVRENVLEDFFDITEERVTEIYNGMCSQGSGAVSLQQLKIGLQRFGLPVLGDPALSKILDVVAGGRSLRLAEFETVLTRLKLAQLLVGGVGDVMTLKPQALGGSGQLTAVDYNAHGASRIRPSEDQAMRKFFFGHRQSPKGQEGANLVRWINLQSMNMTLMLALMVKYGLHPLGVEDVIEQCQTKMDCYGGHYFAAVEQLSLSSPNPPDGSVPVQVRGCHVSVFCAGPPLFDTVITVTQPDRSFAEDWPRDETLEDCTEVLPAAGVARHTAQVHEEAWVERLQQRLLATRSRLRERRADFLMHQVIDLCTDELVYVVRAYTLRLGRIDTMVRADGDAVAAHIAEPEWLQEVSLIFIQLSVVARRVRGLQRVLRHVVDDPDLTAGLSSYLQDVKDHLDEAQEDTAHLREKCEAMIDAYERAMEREQERGRERAADRLNRTLFFLTVVSAVLSPLQLLAGIYGMNFQDANSKPSIPELLLPHGYLLFWLFVLVYLCFATCYASCLYKRMRRKSNEDRDRGAPQLSQRILLRRSAPPSRIPKVQEGSSASIGRDQREHKGAGRRDSVGIGARDRGHSSLNDPLLGQAGGQRRVTIGV